ncbi:MAG: hypothetical protein LBE62_14155 [Azonexus sp.]|jgi:hypothetical protein|nr:hypothetical protein [Azonexus sp.]
MSSVDQNDNSSEATASKVKPLPQGYLWRLCVILVFLLGGAACVIFYNAIIGSLMTLAGLAFGKISGLNEMVGMNVKDKP